MAATSESSAYLILKVLVEDLKLTAGSEVPDRSLRNAFEARGGAWPQIEDGLRYAHGEDWLRHEPAPLPQGCFFLTEAGFELGGD